MSSMLKKTGGLSFKPKIAPRRPAGAPSSSQAHPAPSSASTTRAPTTEIPSQASTPAPTVPPTPSVESSSQTEPPKENPKETPKETTHVESEQPTPPTQQNPAVSATSRPTPPSTASSADVEVSSAPTPAPTERVTTRATAPTPAPAADEPLQQSPSISISPPTDRPTQPTPAPETSASGILATTGLDKPTPNTSVSVSSQPVVTTHTPISHPSASVQSRLAPPTAPPSPAPVSDTIAVSAPTDEPVTTALKQKRVYRKRKTATGDDTAVEGSAPKKKRPRKNPPAEGNGATTTEGAEGAPPVKRTYRRRRRSSTPEDPESQVVNHSMMKMADLTKDLGIGKKFKHAEAIEERARQAREKFRQKRLAKQRQLMGIPLDGEEASRASTPAEGEENGRESAIARARNLGASVDAGAQSVGYEVVDGQIIINQESLVVDRHAAHRDMSSLETVEEDEFSHLTTSASFRRESRRTGANHWTDEDTERFYRLLSMFGTDFETIASMFPGKTRRAVKLKFNREETQRPRRINAAVMVRGEKRVGIDLEEYKAHQPEWRESDAILAEHAELVREHDEDIRRLREERRAAGLIDDDDEVEGQGQEQQQNGEKQQNNGQGGQGNAGGDNPYAVTEEVVVEG
ncbi:Transcription factor TFIIIB component B'' [Daldinia childiae]|uniref:Transcription factor TFIIIB component B'' n=1 Tax=Daldinia childiae TaxID=326645 RepID=UPI0014481CFB|nr:Transcription factor TFIIIB component B'' [Daldinia childiae]KAF3065298.1 Transcription factor TFIIIB component B'' [Daldinia childiae]